MENHDIIVTVKKLQLPLGQYVLFGSLPMCIRGLRDCNDIDILATKELWDTLATDTSWVQSRAFYGDSKLTKDTIEIFYEWKPGEWNTDDVIKRADMIDDVPFARLDDVVRWKQEYGREKDLRDVELIKKFLSTEKA